MKTKANALEKRNAFIRNVEYNLFSEDV